MFLRASESAQKHGLFSLKFSGLTAQVVFSICAVGVLVSGKRLLFGALDRGRAFCVGDFFLLSFPG